MNLFNNSKAVSKLQEQLIIYPHRLDENGQPMTKTRFVTSTVQPDYKYISINAWAKRIKTELMAAVTPKVNPDVLTLDERAYQIIACMMRFDAGLREKYIGSVEYEEEGKRLIIAFELHTQIEQQVDQINGMQVISFVPSNFHENMQVEEFACLNGDKEIVTDFNPATLEKLFF